MLAEPSPAIAAFLEQAGCHVDRIVLADHGVHGNGHLMMMELNNREVLEPILRWLDENVRSIQKEHRAGGAFVHRPHGLSAWPEGFRVRPIGEAST